MEPEKLEEYKDATGIALLNAYNSGILTREEYKLIQRFKKERPNDIVAFLKRASEEEKLEGTINVESTKNDVSIIAPSKYQKEGTKNAYLESTKNVPSKSTKNEESTISEDSSENVPSMAQLPDFQAREGTKIGDSTKNVESTENVDSFTLSRSTVKTDSYKDTEEPYLGLSMVSIKSNFTKLDNDVSDYLNPLQTTTEQSVYNRLYRLSVGWGRNHCRVKASSLMTACNIKDNRTLNVAIDGLIAKGHIQLINRNNKGALYRVFLPGEILGDGETSLTKASFSSIRDTENNAPLSDISAKEGTKNVESTKIVSPLSKDIFKDNLKDTLSLHNIVDLFYTKIGQSKISKEKRERAKKNLEELIEDGFSLQDIQFAIEWTLKNSKEKPYDFSIVKHTIGQAMAAKKDLEAKQARKAEEEREEIRRQEEEARNLEERERVIAYKEALSQDQRAELRERAEAKIRNSGQYKEEFITDLLVDAMENSIIKEQIGIKLSKQE